MRGFGPFDFVVILTILLIGSPTIAPMVPLPVGAGLALLWVRLSRTPWREIGYARPRSWPVTVAVGIALGVAFKFAMKAVVMPLLGAEPVNHAYHFLTGNRALLPAAVWTMVNAGFSEETVYRGFLFERLGRLLGSGVAGKTAIVLVTSALFALAHFRGQGLAGAEQAAVTGLVFGTIFMVTRRIGVLMIAHTAFDLTALAMIYWDLETRVAHLIFR
jgi:hypothetical protein